MRTTWRWCATPSGKPHSTGWPSALDWERGSFIVESLVPEHTELTALLAWSPSVGKLERNPTLKAEMDMR
ncbi:hypothetical protein PTKU46_80020 [Paraburkholderia terrae]|uniref:hypothetical protein n=1 Tax=Paraburkholderia terrae TaxID=311230 RepID=UPI0030E114E2